MFKRKKNTPHKEPNVPKANLYECNQSSRRHNPNIVKEKAYGGIPSNRMALLKKAFTVIDKDANGFLSDTELKAFVRYCRIPMTQEEFNAIYDKCYNEDRGDLRGKFT